MSLEKRKIQEQYKNYKCKFTPASPPGGGVYVDIFYESHDVNDVDSTSTLALQLCTDKNIHKNEPLFRSQSFLALIVLFR